MKAVRKLSLRREALGRLDTDELSRVAGGYVPPTLQNGIDGATYCLISTITWCGYICQLTDTCRTE